MKNYLPLFSSPLRLMLTVLICLFQSLLVAQCPQLVWADEFDGNSLDLTKWEALVGDGCNYGICGWGNNELQYYRAQNAVVSDGSLKIIAREEQVANKAYTSARLRTKNKGDWTYGRFEARLKMPIGQGLWPAFWMLSTNEPYGGWPQSGELDIMEYLGHEPQTVHGTLHFGNAWPNNRSTTGSFELDEGTFHDDFHVFAVEWEANEIRWYVDGFLYLTKNRSDVSPSRWPFDHDFHLLLNLAVGGNWPGNPNSSTVFPQILEVDYVRVYNGQFAYLKGNRLVGNRAEEERYTLLNPHANSSYTWTVPEGANIVEGQGTSSILVNWGDASGEVQVSVNSDCGTTDYSLDVQVEPPFAPDFFFLNFDDPDKLTFSRTSGTYSPDVANPTPSMLNDSELCAKYIRDAASQFDILTYNVSDIPNANVYLTGERKFFIDLYTDAPIGTQVLLQLENKNMATPSNYPTGRHSRFVANTSVQNQWERLELKLLDRPHTGVPANSINELIFLFASNTLTGATYYFDNFASYIQQDVTPIDESQSPLDLIKVFPNPANQLLEIQLNGVPGRVELDLFDLAGRQQLRHSFVGDTSLELTTLAPGVYSLRFSFNRQVIHKRLIKK